MSKSNKKPIRPTKKNPRGCLASGKLLTTYLDNPNATIIIIRPNQKPVNLTECERLENLRD